MKKRLVEWGKNLLLILLVCSTVYLTYRANVFSEILTYEPVARIIQPIAGWFGVTIPESTYAPGTVVPVAACRPVRMAVRNQGGLYGVQYDDGAADELYEKLGRFLGQALGSVKDPEEVSLEQWLVALESEGAYFEFPGEVPLEALALWLGALSGGDFGFADRFFLSAGESSLYYCQEDHYYRADTAHSTSQFAAELEQYRPNSVAFAFELAQEQPAYANVAAHSMISLSESYTPPEVISEYPLSDKTVRDALITSMGFNPYSESGYTDSDGNLVFVENTSVLRVGGGSVVFRSTTSDAASAKFTVSSSDRAGLIESARALIADFAHTGDARLYFAELSSQGGNDVILFDYYISGTKIKQASGYGARVVISNGIVMEISLNMRAYTLSETAQNVMPALQAAAAMTGKGPLVLEYVDNGGDSVTVGWRR